MDGAFYSTDLLKNDWQKLAESSQKTWQRYVFSFCGRWLNDEPQFEVETSGSTGKPKRITLSRRQMNNSAELTGAALGLQPGDRALMCLSPAFVAGKMMLVRAMVLGLDMTVVAASANPFSDSYVGEVTFDFTAFVPLQLQAILNSDGQRYLKGMKAVLLGGADVSGQLLRSVRSLDAPVYQTFGMTETATHIALRKLNGADASSDYRVLPGIKVGSDQRNCLTVKGVVTDGKLLITNDIVEVHSDNSFRWLGRSDNVINSGGIKVHPEKIEAAISMITSRHKLNSGDCMVFGMADERLGQKVAVVFEGEPFDEREQTQMLRLLAAELDRYERPKMIFTLPEFVRGNNGKIDRRQTCRLLAID